MREVWSVGGGIFEIVNKVVRLGIIEKMIFELIFEGEEFKGILIKVVFFCIFFGFDFYFSKRGKCGLEVV